MNISDYWWAEKINAERKVRALEAEVERLSLDLDRVREERDRLRPAGDAVRQAAHDVIEVWNEQRLHKLSSRGRQAIIALRDALTVNNTVSVADQVVQLRNELGEVIRRLDEQQAQIDALLESSDE